MSELELMDDVSARVRKVFASTFGSQLQFSSDLSRLSEPQWTSLKHVELIIGLESEFDLRFDGADATDMVSIAAVLATIRERLA